MPTPPASLYLYSTGVDDSNARLGAGVDSHYFVGCCGSTSNFKVSTWSSPAVTYISAWVDVSSLRASWLGAVGGEPAVWTKYKTSFFLSPAVELSTASLQGKWACDDACDMYLNNVLLTSLADFVRGDYQSMFGFSIPAGSPFHAGWNTLEFSVFNALTSLNPTGIVVFFESTVGVPLFGVAQPGFTWAQGAAQPTVCPAGFVCLGGAGSVQSSCLAGSYCSGGASAPALCPPGSACPLQGTAAPVQCPPGTFSGAGAVACTPCPAGTTSPANSSSSAACAPPTTCPAGFFCPESPRYAYPCIAGYYGGSVNLINATSSGPCSAPPGFGCLAGATSPVPVRCPAGHFCPGGSPAPATPCGTPSHCAELGLSSEPPCVWNAVALIDSLLRFNFGPFGQGSFATTPTGSVLLASSWSGEIVEMYTNLNGSTSVTTVASVDRPLAVAVHPIFGTFAGTYNAIFSLASGAITRFASVEGMALPGWFIRLAALFAQLAITLAPAKKAPPHAPRAILATLETHLASPAPHALAPAARHLAMAAPRAAPPPRPFCAPLMPTALVAALPL